MKEGNSASVTSKRPAEEEISKDIVKQRASGDSNALDVKLTKILKLAKSKKNPQTRKRHKLLEEYLEPLLSFVCLIVGSHMSASWSNTAVAAPALFGQANTDAT